MTAKKTEQTELEVSLKKDHTHAGKPYKSGDKIKVTAAQKDWLIAKGVVSGDTNKESK